MNRKKSGRLFSNLLHTFSVVVRGRRYVLQLQADVSAVRVSRLRQVAVTILSSDLDAWVFQQHADFCRRYLQPSQMSHQVYGVYGHQEMPQEMAPAPTELPIQNLRMGLDASLKAQEPKLKD
eukprot:s2146_g7.t1